MEILRLRPRIHRQRLHEVLALHARVLGPLTPGRFRRYVRGRRSLLLAGLVDDRVVAYKFGFEDRPYRFYSWIGGVDADFRRQGLGSRLMDYQHDWARLRGYTCVRTQTSNEHKPMLILNLLCGFNVTGTVINHAGEPRIILEKKL